MSGERFLARQRLRKRDDFDRVFKTGCSRGNDAFVIHIAANGMAWSRLGIMTSRRLGNAVKRNFARRRVREAFRRTCNDIPVGFDIICLPKRNPDGDLRDMAQNLVRLIAKARAAYEKRESENTSRPVRPPD